MILFVGPMPPPLHGFSQITSLVFGLMKKTGSVYLVNRAGNFSFAGFPAFFYRTALLFFLFPFGRIECVYLALSGGRGQIIDAIYLSFALLFRKKAIIHHHSFNYVNNYSRLFKLILNLSQNSVHIFLCRDMLDKVRKLYGVDLPSATVVSNAAFLDFDDAGKRRRSSKKMVVGFLSNITEEKGIFSYLEVIKALASSGVDVRGVVAGPLDPRIENQFREAISDVDIFEYIGPVYGEDKAKFFARIDIFLFPTKYKNEAEPLVILEALASGIPVVAGNRGCISCLVTSDFGFVSDSEFSTQAAADAVIGLFESDFIYEAASVSALARFKILKNTSSSIFNSLL